LKWAYGAKKKKKGVGGAKKTLPLSVKNLGAGRKRGRSSREEVHPGQKQLTACERVGTATPRLGQKRAKRREKRARKVGGQKKSQPGATGEDKGLFLVRGEELGKKKEFSVEKDAKNSGQHNDRGKKKGAAQDEH